MSKTAHDSATPAHGQQVITACAFIHQKVDGVDQLFLPKRADTKAFLPGKFELPGGHVDFGEDITKGLKREVHEEFGMTITVGDAYSVFTYTNEIKGSHSIQVNYFATFSSPIEDITLNPEDHSTYEWLTKEDALARRAELVAENMIDPLVGDDPQYLDILQGFDLLAGGEINFG